MKIIVCAKQVPDTNEVKIDPVKNTLIRDGVPSILNPDDANALEVLITKILHFFSHINNFLRQHLTRAGIEQV